MTPDGPRSQALPPIHTQADLTNVWSTLMGELGFGSRSLWVMFIGKDDTVHPALMQVEQLDDRPDDLFAANLVQICSHFVDDDPARGRVALLLSRPGRATLTGSDRAWASMLYRAVRLGGIAAEPLHLANDEELRLLAVDDTDLGESA